MDESDIINHICFQLIHVAKYMFYPNQRIFERQSLPVANFSGVALAKYEHKVII